MTKQGKRTRHEHRPGGVPVEVAGSPLARPLHGEVQRRLDGAVAVEPPRRGMTKRTALKSRKAVRRKRDPACSVPQCERPAPANGGLCQTHRRHMRKTGKAQPIRPYRRRTVPTIKFAGLTLTPECAARVREYADKLGLALGGAISEIVEGWMKDEEELAEALKAGDDRP